MPDIAAIAGLSARKTVRLVREGSLAPSAVAQSFAARIAAREPEVQAFTHFDAAGFAAEAAGIGTTGALAGVVLGVKDVIETADMPTAYGSAVYEGVRPAADAPCVALARAAGAVIAGKTVSTEFAMSSPGKTRNPHHPGHTPGGSSSGSCAAVAAGMVHSAFATQTSGSLIRPAAYCGVAGYKPSFGTLNRAGVKVLSDTLDTLGVVAGSLRDAAFVTATLAEDPSLVIPGRVGTPRIGLFRTSRWPLAEDSTRLALDRAVAALAAAGVEVAEIPVPDWFESLFAYHDAVMGWETPRSLAYEYKVLGERISPVTRGFLDLLSKTTRPQYEAAMKACEARADRLDALLGPCDAILTPAAAGEAPRGLGATGDPVFNKAWTLLHGPCVSVPAGKGAGGLPVAVQVVGRLHDDARLLAAAAFVEDALAAAQGGVTP